VLVDCGTSHPVWTQETERRLRGMGVTFLDAPVSGMVAKAEAGTLSIMVRAPRHATPRHAVPHSIDL
jgi:3-hydroxyisobutyrate dehydrogenase